MSDIDNNAAVPESNSIGGTSASIGKKKMRMDPQGKKNLIRILMVVGAAIVLMIIMIMGGRKEAVKTSVINTDPTMSKGGVSSAEDLAVMQQTELLRVRQAQAAGKSGIEQPTVPNGTIDTGGVNGVKPGANLAGPTIGTGTINPAGTAPAPAAPPAPVVDDATLKGIEAQMAQQMKAWGMNVDGQKATMLYERPVKNDTNSAAAGNAGGGTAGSSAASNAAKRGAVVVSALDQIFTGQSVNTHDSDHPGMILTKLATGPLAGAVLYGRGQMVDDGTAATYTDASFEGKKFKINAIALDEKNSSDIVQGTYNGRYVQRFALPIFMEGLKAFTAARAQTGTSVTILGSGGVAQSTPPPTTEQAQNAMISAATSRADKTLSQGPQTGQAFLNRGKTYGIVFIDPVYEGDLSGATQSDTAQSQPANQNAVYTPMQGMPGFQGQNNNMNNNRSSSYSTPGTMPLPGQITNQYGQGGYPQQVPQYQNSPQYQQYSR